MRKRISNPIVVTFFTITLIIGLSGTANAYLYTAPTGQTATVDYDFDGSSLELVVTETTPAAAVDISGAGAVLTSVGFRLPDNVVITGGSANIAGGSSAVDFDTTPPTNDVSGEWGATIGGEQNIDSVGAFDFVSSNGAHVTALGSTNLDGPAVLDGPQGGLLDDSAQRGGLGVIDNSVVILLNLNRALTGSEETAFFAGLSENSIVEYGSNDAWGRIPDPASVFLLGSACLLGFAGLRRRKFRR